MDIIGDYEIVEKIAEGGMGAVYKAKGRGSAQFVAIKVLPPHLAKNPILLKRFEKEYNAAKLLNHGNIVRALAFGYQGESPYLVMEYVEGESLGDLLEREKRLSETRAIQLIAQVAQGLHKAHKQGLVHRDVKPDNIMLTADGQAKLTDMGLVKELETDLNLTRTGRGLGTPHFMAPEQFRNAKNADARCDVYSLAATLYMMVTGELPFKSLGPLDAWMKKVENKLTPPRQLAPHLSERVDWAIRRAMHADPDHRPANCQEFIEDLTGRSTRKLSPAPGLADEDTWYLRYHDEDGVLHTVTASLASVRQSLKAGLLGDASNIRAARTVAGPFELLRHHPEFRDLVLAAVLHAPPPVSANPAKKSSAKPIPAANNAHTLRSAAAATAPAPTTSVVSAPSSHFPATAAPRIHLKADDGPSEFGRLLFFGLIAMLAGVGGFFFFHLLFP